MSKEKVKYYLDFVPLIVLMVSATILSITISTTKHVFLWKHYVGLVLLLITIWLTIKNHKLGIISLGLTLLLGTLNLLSLNIEISTTTIKATSLEIPIFYGSVQYFFLLIIHFILSFRFYFGILSKKYWESFFRELKYK